jgi:hypothetical protein
MDVDSLKAELEKHLAKNPDENAPHGFRDRFNTLVEQYQAEGGSIPKATLEQELQQIRNEAEAAANAAGTESAGDPAPAPRAEAPAEPAPPPPAEAVPSAPVSAPVNASADPAPSGAMPRMLIALVIGVIVLAAAWYFFRR